MAKIVCIEDEADIREDIVDELSEHGHQVFPAIDGFEGLEMVLKHHPDLVICDFLMPRMNGGELFQRLKDQYPEFDDLPFVFLSAHADKEHIDHGKKMGASAYLIKPINFDLLIEVTDKLLKQQGRQPDDQGLMPGEGVENGKDTLRRR